MYSSITLTLPGWLGASRAHWLSRWEDLHGCERVHQHDWRQALRGDWITRLEDVILSKAPGQPIVLVAHGLGCHLVAAWADVSRQAARVHAALLVAPPDLTRPDFPPETFSWRRPVLTRLPFASTCVISTNDPYCSVATGRSLASSWGANCIALDGVGHFDDAAGLRDWSEGRAYLPVLKSSAPNLLPADNELQGH
jgi:uncharacterized protein